MSELTIQGLCDMAFNTADANGWHHEPHETVNPQAPKAQIAALAPIVIDLARVVEAIRKPGASIEDSLGRIYDHIEDIGTFGLAVVAADATTEPQGTPMLGSKTQAIAHIMLMVTELAEAIEAVIAGDTANRGEEYADTLIRIGDDVTWHNRMHPEDPIDLQAAILAKNERNLQRGHRHGGKLA